MYYSDYLAPECAIVKLSVEASYLTLQSGDYSDSGRPGKDSLIDDIDGDY